MAEEKIGEAADVTEEELEGQPPEKLADRVREESEKVGGRVSMIARFGTADIVFTKPLEWCGKTYTEAHLDFNALTGKDIEAIDDELGVFTGSPENSRRYQKLLAAKASKIPSDAIAHLPAADYNAIVQAARYFLMASGYLG